MQVWNVCGAGVLSFILVGIFVRAAPILGLLVAPTHRSMHETVMPRTGGLGFILSWSIFALLFASEDSTLQPLLLPILPAYLIAGYGLVDDKLSLPASLRLGLQCLAVCSSLWWLMQAYPMHLLGMPTLVSVILAGIGLLWSTNLFNFMDGIDGLAGVEGVSVFAGSTVLFYLVGATSMVYLCGALLVSVFGFLLWNWPQSRVFMGNAGSGFLGFIIGVVTLLGELAYHLPVYLWVLMFAVFWFDATVTLIRRFLQGADVTEGHRQHAYQRLVLSGMPTLNVLLGLIGLNLLFFGVALFVHYHRQHWMAGCLLETAILTLVYRWVERRYPMVRES